MRFLFVFSIFAIFHMIIFLEKVFVGFLFNLFLRNIFLKKEKVMIILNHQY